MWRKPPPPANGIPHSRCQKQRVLQCLLVKNLPDPAGAFQYVAIDFRPAARGPLRLEIGPGCGRAFRSWARIFSTSATGYRAAERPRRDRQCGEITALPFPDGRFDLVTACDVVEHVENDRRVFAELTRVLKSDGRLIFSVRFTPPVDRLR